MPKKALLIGATGLTGSFCLTEILKNESYDQLTVVTRRALPNFEQLRIAYPEKIFNLVVDFENLEQSAEYFDVDDVFCCLGTTLKKAGSVEAFRRVDYDYCLTVAKLAEAARVKQFLIITAINSDAKALAYYAKIKGQLQQAISDLNFAKTIYMQPSLLLGERSESRFLEHGFAPVAKLLNMVVPKSLSSFKAIDGEDVAKAMVAAANSDSLRAGINFVRYQSMQDLIA